MCCARQICLIEIDNKKKPVNHRGVFFLRLIIDEL